MSRRRGLLNGWLRRVEKRRLRRGTPDQLRRALEVEARVFFFAPRGTVRRRISLRSVPALVLEPRGARAERVLFYIHGGGFVFGSPETHHAMAATLAGMIGARAVLPRYRRAPEHPYPAAPDDVRAAWDALIASGVDPAQVVLGGDSAGGALAFGLLAALSVEGMALPGAAFGFSPLTDLTYGAESLQRNAAADVLLPAERVDELAQTFLCGADPRDPRVSPIFGAFGPECPAWITVGDTEILQDDARGLAAALRRDGADVTLIEARDCPHVWPIFHNILPEARETLSALAAWIRTRQGWADES
ncbi:alpha/beta hydrolase [Sulfitobacter albidus]|uniref:Alpha/beta hydrolase n=1 Tax=Sulfitobacter albidus TaxID=2829501 RepID=A0A975PMM9_9RHOB|nr:alpha/beta hydrolase fold domain-containing protein [Sulfitobacter albidus]QUJ76596.1 alpha/beta hydrolase [Sulfitobacter albidus]